MKWPLNRLKKWNEIALGLILPPHCAYCQEALDTESIHPQLCLDCRQIYTLVKRSCRRCGAIRDNELECLECRNQKFAFDEVVSLGIYEGALAEGVLRMKYEAGQPLAAALGRHLAWYLECNGRAEEFDLATCVPKHWMKRLFTGINSPEVIMQGFAKRANLPQAADLLLCRRRIRKQSLLSPEQRRRNVRQAWSVSTDYKIAGSHVLLIDDIMTTGATAHQISRALKKAGAKRVTVAVVGRAKKMQ